MKLLFIDDSRLENEMRLDLLREEYGYSVDFISDANKVLSTIPSIGKNYDLVILDIMMRRGKLEPKPDEKETGVILFRLIRESAPMIPILVVSVKGLANAPSKMREDGNLKWLKKPVDTADIAISIRQFLSK